MHVDVDVRDCACVMDLEHSLEERLRSHSACFISMVELIPAQYYVVKEDQVLSDGKFWLNKRRKAPKEAIKAASKKAKRIKLDPKAVKGSQKLECRGEEEKMAGGEETDSVGEDEDKCVFETEEDLSLVPGASGFSVERVPSAGLNDLRERLHSKIDGLRAGRTVMTEKASDEENDDVQAIKRKRKAETCVKDKKEKRKEKMLKARKQAARNIASAMVKPSPAAEPSSGIRFSKIEFSGSSKDKRGRGQSKDLKRMLEKAELAKKKIAELKEEDDVKAAELEGKMQWRRAVEMAQGTKLKDDPHLLKKSIKRREKKHERSRKGWDERVKQAEEHKSKRSEKRRKNIAERVTQIKEKKVKKKMKRRGKA